MKQKHWILTFAAIIAVCLLVWLLPRGGGQTALVYQDGTLFYTLDLRQNRTLTVTGPAGKTIITVADGEVFVSHADCPDQVCVQRAAAKKRRADHLPAEPADDRVGRECVSDRRAQRDGRAVMRLKKLTLTAVLTAAALVMFVLESQLPPLTAIPGIKPGLSNIFTLFTMETLGPGWAFGLFLTRVTLGCVITGQGSAFLYSFAGGLCAYALMLLLRSRLRGNMLWVRSVLCAMAHNTGQLAAAAAIAKTGAVWSYLPVLIPAAILAGTLTGLCAQLVLNRLAKAGVLPKETGSKKQEEEANG